MSREQDPRGPFNHEWVIAATTVRQGMASTTKGEHLGRPIQQATQISRSVHQRRGELDWMGGEGLRTSGKSLGPAAAKAEMCVPIVLESHGNGLDEGENGLHSEVDDGHCHCSVPICHIMQFSICRLPCASSCSWLGLRAAPRQPLGRTESWKSGAP